MLNKEFHPAVVKQLGGRKIKHIFTGGGVGMAIHAVDKKGNETILKISTSDGLNNGRRKLIREAKQILYLRSRFPEIKDFLPEIIDMVEGKDFAIVEYPFYKGETFASMVVNKRLSDKELARIFKELTVLCGKFYLLDYQKRENDFLSSKNIVRAQFRVGYIHNKNPKISKVANSKKIKINGKWYVNPGLLVQNISDNANFVKKINPKYLGDCMHGDLNLTNLMVTKSGFKLLDFRGSRQKWDLVYDLGKMAFTSGYESIRTDRIVASILKDNSLTLKFSSRNLQLINSWENLLFRFEDIIEKEKVFDQIRKRDPYLKTRLRLSFALHYLADSACRLVAGSFTSQPLASFLLGTIYLNRFASDLDTKMPAPAFYSMKSFLLP